PTTIKKAVVRLPQLRAWAWSTVATRPWLPGAGHRGDDPGGGVDFTDDGVQTVDDIDVAVGVYLQRVGLVQRCPRGETTIAAVAQHRRPGHGGNHPRDLIDTAYTVVRRFGHVQVTLRVKGTHERLTEQCLKGWATVTGVALGPGASDRLDDVKCECHKKAPHPSPLPEGEGTKRSTNSVSLLP